MSQWVISVVSGALADVRFTPNSDRLLRCREMTVCAISDQNAVQQTERPPRPTSVSEFSVERPPRATEQDWAALRAAAGP